MNSLNESQLRALARIDSFPCVTLQFPAEGGGALGRPDIVRLRNGLREVRVELAAAGTEAGLAEEILAPAIALADDPEFWLAPAGGVALFAAPGFFRPVRVDHELPERGYVGRRFLLRALLAGLDRPGLVYVLALSRKRVRLLASTGEGVREIELPGLPADFAAAVGELQFQSAVQARTSSPAALGRRPAIFHGHGDDDEEHIDADLESFFRRVIEVLEARLPVPDAPIVLAAVAEHVPAFRRVSRRLRLLSEVVAGNPDPVADTELAAAARKLVQVELDREIERELDRWSEMRASRKAIDELKPVLRAADAGQVETLFLAREAERWGTYEPDLGRMMLHEQRKIGDEELLDRAASRTLAHGGDVHAVKHSAMPEGRIASAILRFPLTD